MIYIHVPFCKSRCIYCDFYSTTQTPAIRSRYVRTLCAELQARVGYLSDSEVHTLYFGGGTPSQLSLFEIEQIMQSIRANYQVAPDAEITFEANPDDITVQFVRGLRQLGFNRMSLGVQSFDDKVLRMLNRRHTAAKAYEAVETIVAEGIPNVSIDLIYGLPAQTLDDFRRDLKRAFSLPVRHLSSYALSVEENTLLHRKVQRGELQLPDEELFLQEYTALMEAADAYGFSHYEISNFALPGYESRHNSGYWYGIPYLGCGPGAHSFDGVNRRYNLPDLLQYIDHPACPLHENESLTPDEHFNEFVMISLRTSRGLSLEQVKTRFGADRLNETLLIARDHIAHNRL